MTVAVMSIDGRPVEATVFNTRTEAEYWKSSLGEAIQVWDRVDLVDTDLPKEMAESAVNQWTELSAEKEKEEKRGD